ncbi:DUF6538 domain-containing protein [Emcibacter sp.]|uniref:DUF6538 domain-containing protein n=1 Tax=Emcibacter sp. TaxID=1979954 RepID=UPI003A9199B2
MDVMRRQKEAQYLYLRDGKYYFRMIIPERFRSLYDNLTEIKQSLKTSDKREALKKHHQILSEFYKRTSPVSDTADVSSITGYVPSEDELERAIRAW